MSPTPQPSLPSAKPVLLWLLVLTLALTGAHLATWTAAGAAPGTTPGTDPAPRATTTAVEALDDARGSRWRAANGTTTARIAVGDTVEWRFDTAGLDHDLTSATDSPTPWPTPVAVFKRPGDAPFRMRFDAPGTYTYLCSLHGVTMSGTVVVEAAGAANQAPVVDPMVGGLSGTVPLAVSVMAHASDPDGDPLTYEWDFGTGLDTDRSPFEDASFVYTTPGFYTLGLRVRDDRGGVVERSWPVTVGGGTDAPTVRAAAQPASGVAPLPVAFSVQAHDDQGDDLTYAWDFGVPGDTDVADTPTATWTYTTAGTRTATVTVTDDEGHVGVDTVEVVVAEDGASLPEVRATRSVVRGSRTAAFSTEVTTRGDLTSYADGLATDPGLAGTATLVRRRGSTTARLDVTELRPGAFHEQVHVHEHACGDARAGAHFRFDETRPFGAANEIWLPFTSDGAGRSGPVVVTQPLRAGPRAVSVVVHDPADPARRIGCADLLPATAGLAYTWDFGDGTGGTGPDPDHAYARDGRYTATLTVGGPHADHGAGAVRSTVAVVVDTTPPQTTITRGPASVVRSSRAAFTVASSEPGSTFACRLDRGPWGPCAATSSQVTRGQGSHLLEVRATDRAGNTDRTPAARRWLVDAVAPRVGDLRPASSTRDRTPTVSARVVESGSGVRATDVVLLLDGRRAAGVRWDPRRGVASWTPGRVLSRARHTARLTVTDVAGNRTTRAWRFRVS